MEFASFPSMFWAFLNLRFISSNVVSSLWIFVSTSFWDITISDIHDQFISLVCDLPSNRHMVTFAYARVLYEQRRLLWNFLVQLYSFSCLSWVVVGDFNAISESHEKFTMLFLL